MNQYRFAITFGPGKTPLEKSFALIEIEADNADSPFANENIIGNELDVALLRDYLKTAYCMYGHTFNLESHTPRQLYEALTENKDYEFHAEGDFSLNGEDDSLPDGALS